jgi:hypothetical protein
VTGGDLIALGLSRFTLGEILSGDETQQLEGMLGDPQRPWSGERNTPGKT